MAVETWSKNLEKTINLCEQTFKLNSPGRGMTVEQGEFWENGVRKQKNLLPLPWVGVKNRQPYEGGNICHNLQWDFICSDHIHTHVHGLPENPPGGERWSFVGIIIRRARCQSCFSIYQGIPPSCLPPKTDWGFDHASTSSMFRITSTCEPLRYIIVATMQKTH